MSIIAYVGLPGSGKSYDVVANQILPGLKDNRRVVTNIPLNRDVIRKDILSGEIVELPLDVIAQEPHKLDEYAVPGSLLVLDEVWRLWPAGLKTDKIPQPFKSFLAEHRHRVDKEGRATQIVLVTQDLAQIAAFARQLVEQTFHHTKLSDMGMRGSYRIDIFHGAVTGAVPPMNNRLREVFGKYSPKVFKYYKSHTMSESAKAGAQEVAMDTRGNRWKRPIVYVTAIAIPCLFAYGIYNLYRIFGPELAGSAGGAPAAGASTGETALAVVTNNTASAHSVSLPPAWRISGVVRVGRDLGYVYITNGQRVRTLLLSQCQDDIMGVLECDVDHQRARYDWPSLAADQNGMNLFGQSHAD